MGITLRLFVYAYHNESAYVHAHGIRMVSGEHSVARGVWGLIEHWVWAGRAPRAAPGRYCVPGGPCGRQPGTDGTRPLSVGKTGL